jgi:rhodanese-related sulfurtransferase
MTREVRPEDVKAWLSDGDEIAFFDVREAGQFGEGHPFFAIPLPYSVFESRLSDLAPNRGVRMVLMDGGDGVVGLAAKRAVACGYADVAVMKGGARAWAKAGYTLYQGVNLPSKTFGEILEIERHTPRKSAEEVAAMSRDGTDHVIVDGRPYAEYEKFNIPGGICCPNGELALRIGEIAPDPNTTIVVNCAGRTRSILGAQTLIDFGVPNPVYALENGTQGWFLAGMQPEKGADRRYPEAPADAAKRAALREKSRRRAEATGVKFISAEDVQAWWDDTKRTTYVFDVRTEEEYDPDRVVGVRHAPGGQLVQATDQWVGVKGARIVLVDDDLVRAPMVANWLYQLGHDVAVLEGGIDALEGKRFMPPPMRQPPEPVVISPRGLLGMMHGDGVNLVDLRSSESYRAGHIEGAAWSIRPRLDRLAIDDGKPTVLIGDAMTAALAAERLNELGHNDARRLEGDVDAWRTAGHKIVETPDDPPDSERIDFLFHTYRRQNDAEHARQYLSWETGLVDQLDDQERESFRIAAA